MPQKLPPLTKQKYAFDFNDLKKIKKSMILSKNHLNMIYIMIDMTTGPDVMSILQRDDNLLGKHFNGFTNFCNLISTNHATNASLPNLYGGHDHNPSKKNTPGNEIHNMTFLEYMRKSIDTLVSPFGEKGWNINLINPQYFHYDESKGYWPSDWKAIEEDFKKYGLNCFSACDISRYMIMNYPELYADQDLPEKLYEWDTHANDNVALDALTKMEIQSTENPCFMLFTAESNHTPFAVDKNGKYKLGEENAESAYNSTEGFIKKIVAFIEYLKENDIYDNTMLCIVSDHGSRHGSLPVFDDSYNFSGQDYSNIRRINEQFLLKETPDHHFIRHFPTMLIKPYNMRHEIVYNHEDLHCNTDVLSYIEYHNPDLDFTLLRKTQDPRYCSPEEIKNRKLFLPSFGADSLWRDDYTLFRQPFNKKYGHHSFLIRESIYDPQKFWMINAVSAYEAPLNKFPDPENTEDWITLEQYLQAKQEKKDEEEQAGNYEEEKENMLLKTPDDNKKVTEIENNQEQDSIPEQSF